MCSLPDPRTAARSGRCAPSVERRHAGKRGVGTPDIDTVLATAIQERGFVLSSLRPVL
jgi:hypothetical protein